ncbi:hypothetical protein NL676_025216 [Syzygium grande]|nr:hypothetical protein NL676_025216 [Syzygium grande]
MLRSSFWPGPLRGSVGSWPAIPSLRLGRFKFDRPIARGVHEEEAHGSGPSRHRGRRAEVHSRRGDGVWRRLVMAVVANQGVGRPQVESSIWVMSDRV